MKNLFAISVFLAAFLACSASASADESEACMAAVAKLDSFLMSQPKPCQSSSDCQTFYFSADPCGDPVVLSKDSVKNQSFMLEMVEIQMQARAICAKDWARRPACTAGIATAVCREGQCTKGRNR